MDEFVKAVCEKHGLTALSVTYIARNDQPFIAYPHRGDNCGSGSGSTVDEAIREGLSDLDRRFPSRAA